MSLPLHLSVKLLGNARAKGKKFGRPRAQVDALSVAALRRDGLSWSQVCRTLNISKGSAQRSVACPTKKLAWRRCAVFG